MMKTYKVMQYALLLVFSILASCNNNPADISGRTYDAIRIGNQIWMAENLDVGRFSNGDEITEAKTPEEWIIAGQQGKPAWCYFENDSANEDRYGRLYNWYALTDDRGLAPRGWHIPSDDEWTAMINYLGGSVSSAMTLKAVNQLEEQDAKPGFNGLPAGCRNHNGAFYGLGSYAYWWSATADADNTAWLRVLSYAYCDINFVTYDKTYGASIRCIKN